MLCVTRNRLAAGFEPQPGRAREVPDGQRGVLLAGVEPGADGRRAEIQLLESAGRMVDVVGAAGEARGVAAELLAERHRHRVLQVRPADLEHRRRTRRPCAQATPTARGPTPRAAPCTEEQREPRRRREHVVRRLSHVDVVVRVNEPVLAARAAEELGGAVREHLVGVHVVRRAGARLVDVDDELVAQARRPALRRPPGRWRRRSRASRRSSATLACAAAFLTRMVAVTRSAGARKPADGEVLDGPRRLDAVVGVGRNGRFTEGIALGPEHGSPGVRLAFSLSCRPHP